MHECQAWHKDQTGENLNAVFAVRALSVLSAPQGRALERDLRECLSQRQTSADRDHAGSRRDAFRRSRLATDGRETTPDPLCLGLSTTHETLVSETIEFEMRGSVGEETRSTLRGAAPAVLSALSVFLRGETSVFPRLGPPSLSRLSAENGSEMARLRTLVF